MPWKEVIPVVEPSVRKLCVREYHGHRRGCPNFNKKAGCPPSVSLIGETIDLTEEVFAIWNVYPFGEHVAKMKKKHPEWSQRQLECCLYWQGTARKQLKGIIEDFFMSFIPLGRENYVPMCIVKCPEAQGVNLTETMKTIGVELEWPPKEHACQIVLAGKPHGKTKNTI